MINNRGFDDGDFGTPERDYDSAIDELPAFDRPTEACQSVGVESWGYKRDEDYYTDGHLIRSIDKYMARGANYLLNVGPMADGAIPPEPKRILRSVGEWYARAREAFDGAEPAPHLTENRDVLLTRRGNTLYVHAHKPPASARVVLKPIARLPRKATLLNTGAPVEVGLDLLPSQHVDYRPYLRLRNLPANELSNTALVIKLEFDDTGWK